MIVVDMASYARTVVVDMHNQSHPINYQCLWQGKSGASKGRSYVLDVSVLAIGQEIYPIDCSLSLSLSLSFLHLFWRRTHHSPQRVGYDRINIASDQYHKAKRYIHPDRGGRRVERRSAPRGPLFCVCFSVRETRVKRKELC